jgi:hypothetical protein
MSGGMEDARALGEISQELENAAWQLRKAIVQAEQGHRGLSVSIEATVNDVLLEGGWKLVRAEKVEVYR